MTGQESLSCLRRIRDGSCGTRGVSPLRVASLEEWRDGHVSSTQPHAICALEDRRKVDEHEGLKRIERKIEKLEERIDVVTERFHGRD